MVLLLIEKKLKNYLTKFTNLVIHFTNYFSILNFTISTYLGKIHLLFLDIILKTIYKRTQKMNSLKNLSKLQNQLYIQAMVLVKQEDQQVLQELNQLQNQVAKKEIEVLQQVFKCPTSSNIDMVGFA